MMSNHQNICLICCYSFPAKISRFISAEARESFRKFSRQLGFSPLNDGENGGDHLNLPFGDSVTVCGDCLSLVLVYVQRRAVQEDKEERLKELQRAVCKALKELSSVVEDVKCHLDQLHSAVKTGDEVGLGEFINRRRSPANKQRERKVKSFREKVLNLNAGTRRFQKKDVRCLKEGEPIFIKTEPGEDGGEEGGAYINDIFNDNSNLELEASSSKFTRTRPLSSERKESTRSRRTVVDKDKRVHVPFDMDENEDSCQDDAKDTASDHFDGDGLNFQDFDNDDDDEEEDDSVSGRSDEDDDEDYLVENTEKSKRQRRPIGRPPNPSGSKRLPPGVSAKFGTLLSPQKAAQWKDALFHRITATIPPSSSTSTIEPMKFDPQEESQQGENEAQAPASHFQIINDQLQLLGITVKIHPTKRMLECEKCQRMYFEERDVIKLHGGNIPIESLMKTHILDKHHWTFTPKPKTPPKILDCTLFFASQTKNKITYKLADKNGYSYSCCRIYTNNGIEAKYYRCDCRKLNCAAAILFRDDQYTQLRKGWNSEGFHEHHPPNQTRTNQLVALGNAKEMYLTDKTKSLEEVCTIIRGQVGGEEESVSTEKLRRAMRLSRKRYHGGIPEEDKRIREKEEQMCCFCGKILKNRGAMTRHLLKIHPQEGEESKKSVGGGVKIQNEFEEFGRC